MTERERERKREREEEESRGDIKWIIGVRQGNNRSTQLDR